MNARSLLLLGCLLSAAGTAQAWYGGPPTPWYGPYGAPPAPAYRSNYQRTPEVRIQTQPSAEGYLVTIKLQGSAPADINVTRSGRWLLVQKTRADERSEQAPGSWSYSRSFGSFSRRITLPRDADLEAMTRQDGEGLILLTVPRIAR